MLKGNLTCKMVSQLISLYIEDKLNEYQRNRMATHLRNCPACMEKYRLIKSLCDEIKLKNEQKLARLKMNEEISAYCDGEITRSNLLSTEVKKLTNAEFEAAIAKTMNTKKVLSNSFNNLRNTLDFDLSKEIVQKIKDNSGICAKLRSFFRTIGAAKRRFL